MENEDKKVQSQKTIITVIATAVVTTVLSAVTMGIIAPNNLRVNMETVKLEQATSAKQMDTNTGNISNLNIRLYSIEGNQLNLATKADLQTLKEDLIRELKR